MAWSTVPAVVAGVPLPKATWLDPVTADLNIVGGAWTADARASTAIWTTTGASLGNGTLVSQYRLAGKTLDWLLILTFGSTTSAGSSQFAFAYPGPVSVLNPGTAVTVRYFDSSLTQTYMGMGVVNTATVNLQSISSAAGMTTSTNSTTPMTWATGDVATFLLTGCEVA